jgi:hypothetical protein
VTTKKVMIDGVLREVKVMPPGRAEGAYFQQWSFSKRGDFGSSGTNQIDPNPPGDDTPELKTVQASLNMDVRTWREILTGDDEEVDDEV